MERKEKIGLLLFIAFFLTLIVYNWIVYGIKNIPLG